MFSGNLKAYPVYLGMRAADYAFRSVIYVLLTVYYVQTIGMNPLQLVLVGTVLEATAFVCEIPTGILADIYSRRLSVVIGTAVVGVGFIIEGLVPLFAAILLAEAIRSVGETCISGAQNAWVADELGEARLAHIYLRGGQAANVGGLVGTIGGVLLSHIALWVPVCVGGVLMVGLAGAMALLMPERGFQPIPRSERASWHTMFATTREGIRVVRTRPFALTIVIIGVLYGIQSEGFDRLWEAHLLKDFQFPILGALQPQDWFGIISVGSTAISFITAELFVRRMGISNTARLTRVLMVVNVLTSGCVIGFALAGNFALAVVALWVKVVADTVNWPLYSAWLNQNLDPKVRATVLSFSSQLDALGQSAGGPVVGAVGNGWGLRAALTLAGLLLTPVSLLYHQATRRGTATIKAEVEVQAVE